MKQFIMNEEIKALKDEVLRLKKLNKSLKNKIDSQLQASVFSHRLLTKAINENLSNESPINENKLQLERFRIWLKDKTQNITNIDIKSLLLNLVDNNEQEEPKAYKALLTENEQKILQNINKNDLKEIEEFFFGIGMFYSLALEEITKRK